jgi:molecular chaperone DnaK (HSP70)
MVPPAVAIDFGTTNSSIACVQPGGAVELVRFPSLAGPTASCRSLLYMEQAQLGVPVRSAVVGRPVHFVGADTVAEDETAEIRLRESFRLAGDEFTRNDARRMKRMIALICSPPTRAQSPPPGNRRSTAPVIARDVSIAATTRRAHGSRLPTSRR